MITMNKQTFLERIEPFLKQYANEIYDFSFGPREERIRKNWYATDLGSCLRGVYFDREGKLQKKPLPEFVKNVGHEGKMKELELISKLILEGNEILETQIRLYDEQLDTAGRPDAIIRTPDGQVIVEEIKTVNSRSFWHRTNENEFEAYPHHIAQITFYLAQLNEKYPGIKGRLCYRSRDDGTTIFIPVEFDQELWNTISQTLEYLNQCWNNKTLPTVPDSIIQENGKYKLNWKAQYCDYHHHCLQDDNWESKAKEQIKLLNKESITSLENKK